jgi:hypothetical protein
VTTTESKGSSSKDKKIHDDNKTFQKLQPKTQNNNNMETLTMAAQKTVAMKTVAVVETVVALSKFILMLIRNLRAFTYYIRNLIRIYFTPF